MAKVYAVKVGRKPGIYYSWDEVKEQVNGVSGAEHKRFNNEKDAENWLNGSFVENQSHVKQTPTIISGDTLTAYVDGSFDETTQRYSFGAVVIKNNEVIHKLSKVGNNPKYLESRQIAGEVFSVIHVLNWAVNNGYKKVVIHYDYLGIEKWATNEWKSNKAVGIDYKEWFSKFASHIDVSFVKVQAHTGDYYNEMVDDLAKEALGLL